MVTIFLWICGGVSNCVSQQLSFTVSTVSFLRICGVYSTETNCQISILVNLKTFPLKIRSLLAAGRTAYHRATRQSRAHTKLVLKETWPLKKIHISCTGPSCQNWLPDFLLVKQNSFTTVYPMTCQNKPASAAWICTWNTHSFRGHISL